MTASVFLRYQRDPNAGTSSGHLLLADGAHPRMASSFAAMPYGGMLRALAKTLAQLPAQAPVQVFIERTDREGLRPYSLSEPLVQLLRTDVDAAVQAMEYPSNSPSATVRRVQRERVYAPVPPLDVGYASLLESFGDAVFFRIREGALECPGCGFWTPVPALGAEGFLCAKRCRGQFLAQFQRATGCVRVPYLLSRTPLARFYFPRAWNAGRAWVTRADLQTRYDAFVAERAGVQ